MEFDGAKMVWILSTDFGRMVFVMIFITWTLIIINLSFTALIMVHKIFGKQGILQFKKRK